MIKEILDFGKSYNVGFQLGNKIGHIISAHLCEKWNACVHAHYYPDVAVTAWFGDDNEGALTIKVSIIGKWIVEDWGDYRDYSIKIESALESVLGPKKEGLDE